MTRRPETVTLRPDEPRPEYDATRSERARVVVARTQCTTGYVVVGTLPGRPEVARYAVEHASYYGVLPDYARLFRDYPPGSPDWLSDGSRGRAAAERQVDVLSRDYLVGEGLDYAVFALDAPDCPILVDWAFYMRTWSMSRGRDPLFLRRNLPVAARGLAVSGLGR